MPLDGQSKFLVVLKVFAVRQLCHHKTWLVIGIGFEDLETKCLDDKEV